MRTNVKEEGGATGTAVEVAGMTFNTAYIIREVTKK